jgi:hypothetical protein
MTVDEQARLALLARLNETLGPEHASTLMASLPAADWTDLATKDDLGAVRSELLAEMSNIEHRLTTALHRELTVQTRIYVLAIITTVVALSSVAVFTS